MQKHVNLVDLVKSFPTNIYLLAKIDVDTAENEPLTVWRKIQFIFHSPPFLGPGSTFKIEPYSFDVQDRDRGLSVRRATRASRGGPASQLEQLRWRFLG